MTPRGANLRGRGRTVEEFDMDNATCVTAGCERTIWVKATGECSTCQSRRYRRENPGKGRTVYEGECFACGEAFSSTTQATTFCSLSCSKRRLVSKLPPKHPVRAAIRVAQRDERRSRDQALWRSRRSPLRAAIEDGDRAGVVAAIRSHTRENESGCWIWQRKLNDGYPTVNIGGRWHQVHRLVIEASLGAPLGSQHAHHICATPACVSPDHLQPVTHRDNVAEMLARQSYLARIAELEDALAAVAPSHPLLSVIAVA